MANQAGIVDRRVGWIGAWAAAAEVKRDRWRAGRKKEEEEEEEPNSTRI